MPRTFMPVRRMACTCPYSWTKSWSMIAAANFQEKSRP
jgi:hypothetical protein